MFTWTQILIALYILSSISAIIVLAIALAQCNKRCGGKDGFCNCFGPQYDGSSGDPDMPTYPGTYCTNNKPGLSQAYRNGVTNGTIQGV